MANSSGYGGQTVLGSGRGCGGEEEEREVFLQGLVCTADQ